MTMPGLNWSFTTTNCQNGGLMKLFWIFFYILGGSSKLVLEVDSNWIVIPVKMDFVFLGDLSYPAAFC